jgi:hypothetical protein
MRWLKRLLRRSIAMPPRQSAGGRDRAQRLARLVAALDFYADPDNYARSSLLRAGCPAMRDRGRRARHALAMLRSDGQQ